MRKTLTPATPPPQSRETKPGTRFRIEEPINRRFTTPFRTGVKYAVLCKDVDFGDSRRNPGTDRLLITFVAQHPTTGNDITTWHNTTWTQEGLQIGGNDLKMLLTGMLGTEAPELSRWFNDLGDILPELQDAVEDDTLDNLLVGNYYEIVGDVSEDRNTGNQNYRIRSITPIKAPPISAPRVASTVRDGEDDSVSPA